MSKKMTEEEIRELEKQLGCPSGAKGIEVGKTMNDSNIGMTLNSIEFLDIRNDDSILELGHGNCGHLEKIMNSANGVNYSGLEVSATMWKEAQKNNFKGRAEFELYDGIKIPYGDDRFDRALSVNTIYFWSDPEKLIDEIGRTLKEDGVFVLTYAEKEFMEQLPIVGAYFDLFDKDDIRELVSSSNMKIIDMRDMTEHTESKTGEEVKRAYTMVKMTSRP